MTSQHQIAEAPRYTPERLKRFFEPRSVVLIGAAERTLYTQCTVQNAQRFQTAPLHLVNRRGVSVLGKPAAVSCVALNEEIDTAFIQVPAVYVFEALEDAHEAGIRNVVVLSSGFAEADLDGAAAQLRLAERARDLDILLLGPNHVGFLNLVHNISVFALPAPREKAGSVAVLSQSGAIAMEIARFGEKQDVATSHLVTLGNEAMLSASDALSYVVECPETRAILMFMEGIKYPDRFEAAALRAAELGKPIIVYKVGMTEIAAKSAAAHTGALVGDDKVTNAVFKELGVIRVSSLEDLVITGKLAASLGKVRVRGVGVISASGGANDIVADVAEPSGVPLAEFSSKTKQAIVDVVPDNFITAQNPFDLTGSSVRDRTLWRSVTGIIGNDPGDDLVLCLGALITDPEPQAKDLMVAEALNALSCPYIYTTTLSSEISDHSASIMARSGFKLVSTGIVPTLRALGAIAAWSEVVPRAVKTAVNKSPKPVPASPHRTRPWSEVQARAFLSNAGIPVIEASVVRDADEAVAAAAKFGGSVVAKIVSSDILHKSDIGGVELNLVGAQQVRAAFDRVIEASKRVPHAKIDGVLISPMRTGGIELIVGVIRDPQWGPTLVLGLGGIFVEVLNDSVIVPLPTSADRVDRALSTLRGAPLLNGVRGTRAVDKKALCDVIVRIGDLAGSLGDDLDTLEINPLVIDGSTIEALDALVTWKTNA